LALGNAPDHDASELQLHSIHRVGRAPGVSHHDLVAFGDHVISS
jgi:hypothetical protein